MISHVGRPCDIAQVITSECELLILTPFEVVVYNTIDRDKKQKKHHPALVQKKEMLPNTHHGTQVDGSYDTRVSCCVTS